MPLGVPVGTLMFRNVRGGIPRSNTIRATVAACCAAASVEGEGVAAIPDRATLEARLAAYRRRQVG